jgi:cytochrome P450
MTTLAELDADPYPTYARLRAHEPVCWAPAAGHWLVTGWRDVLTVLSDPERFANEQSGVHAAFRRAYEPGLDHAEVATITRPVARKAADDLFAAGCADLTADYFEPVATVAGATLLGIGVGGADTLRRWGVTLATAANDPAGDPAAGDDDLTAVVGRLRHRPDGTLVARLAHGDADVVPLLKHVALSVVEPGWLAAWTLTALWGDPEQLAAVHRDRRLLGPAVYEALRWSTPIGALTRRTTGPVSLGGREIAAGEPLAAVIASANRDEVVFPDPDRFDVRRRLRANLGFGVGPRHCPAHPLVTSVARTALDVLFDRMPDVRPAPGSRPAPHGWKVRLPGPLDAEWGTRFLD